MISIAGLIVLFVVLVRVLLLLALSPGAACALSVVATLALYPFVHAVLAQTTGWLLFLGALAVGFVLGRASHSRLSLGSSELPRQWWK